MTHSRLAAHLKYKFFSFRLVSFLSHQATCKQALFCLPELHARKTELCSPYIRVSVQTPELRKQRLFQLQLPQQTEEKASDLCTFQLVPWSQRTGLHRSSLVPTPSLTPGGAASFVLIQALKAGSEGRLGLQENLTFSPFRGFSLEPVQSSGPFIHL